MTSQPRALVTGITGQDGSYLAERLLSEGWQVHALVRPGRNEEQPIDPAVEQHVGDLAVPDRLAEVVASVEPDRIFNLAGISSVATSWEKPVLTSEVTGVAVVALLEAAWQLQRTVEKEVRFVQASSSEIFGAATDVPQNESTAIRPITPYGAAKAFAHHSIGVYRARGLFAASGILYNHESTRRPTTFVTRKITQGVARIALGLDDSLVLGNMDALRDWGWAPDYVDALWRIGAAIEPDDFVIATGLSHTVRDFVSMAFSAAGISDWERLISVDERFMRPGDAPEMRGDATKAQRVLAWAPSVSLAEIVKRMVVHDMELLRL